SRNNYFTKFWELSLYIRFYRCFIKTKLKMIFKRTLELFVYTLLVLGPIAQQRFVARNHQLSIRAKRHTVTQRRYYSQKRNYSWKSFNKMQKFTFARGRGFSVELSILLSPRRTIRKSCRFRRTLNVRLSGFFVGFLPTKNHYL